MSRITFGKAFEPQPPQELIPEAFLASQRERFVEQWGQERILVLIQRTAYDAMHDHTHVDNRHECTGLMVGQVFYDPEHKLPFVLIEHTFPINASSKSGAHVHVDAGRFAEARAKLERLHPGATIVGWYHTHPNLGIFLSGTDRKVTEGLFNASWHVAVVIDPVRKEEGCFVERGHKRLSGMIIVDRPTPIAQFYSLYRHAEALLEAHDVGAAADALQRLEEYFRKACASPTYQSDVRLWQLAGTYRDAPTLLARATASRQDEQSGSGDTVSAFASSYALERQLQDLQRGQSDLGQELRLLSHRLAQASRRPFTVVDLVGLLLGLTIATLLAVDIYLQQARTQTLVEQNRQLSELVQQNSSLEQTLLLLASPGPAGTPDTAGQTTVAPPLTAIPSAPPANP